MTADEIIHTLQQYLTQHQTGARGIVQQDPYKSDIFRLFAETVANDYHERGSPLLTGDAMLDVLEARYPLAEGPDPEGMLALRREVHAMWDEWIYCHENYDKVLSRVRG